MTETERVGVFVSFILQSRYFSMEEKVRRVQRRRKKERKKDEEERKWLE